MALFSAAADIVPTRSFYTGAMIGWELKPFPFRELAYSLYRDAE